MNVQTEHVKVASNWAVYGFVFASLCCLMGAAVAGGVKLERQKPRIQVASVADWVRAGDNLHEDVQISVPPGCIPRQMRQLCTERSCSNHYPSPTDPFPFRKNHTQLLTDSAIVAQGDVAVPMPRDTTPRSWPRIDGKLVTTDPNHRGWFLIEAVSDQGCGALSGILKPNTTYLHDASGQVGIPMNVLPWSPVPTQ